MSLWAQIKHAINNSLGRRDFKPLNELVQSEIQKSEHKMLEAISLANNVPGLILSIPEGTQTIPNQQYKGRAYRIVSIPEGVVSIGKEAFQGCENLTTLIMPSGVKVIGEDAFADCTSLTSVKITKEMENIGIGAFSNCTNLLRVEILDGVEVIPATIFSMSLVAELILPRTLTNVEEAFLLCRTNTIYYDGTKEMFNKIKGINNLGFPPNIDGTRNPIIVHCSDGIINLEYQGE